jgi:16S rRNA (cytosine1402-N4)-methyltransferase
VNNEDQAPSNDSMMHVPVLLHQSLDLLNIQSGKIYVDATAGGGGHLGGILEGLKASNSPGRSDTEPGRVIGIDRDLKAIEHLKPLQQQYSNQLSLFHANYADLSDVIEQEGLSTINGGILADLGVSSMHLDEAQRGFSFLRDGPLDMRMDSSQSTTAEHLINSLSEQELADIIFKYGEERFARQIARGIVHHRPLRTTGELAEVVSRSLSYQKRRIGSKKRRMASEGDSSHPATRTFQAIRIAVNNELESLENFLNSALALLAPGARLVVITFHSLEDRIVKQFLRRAATDCLCPPRQPVCTCHHKSELLIITRKPIVAGEKEVLANVRSRSAKLRAGEKS